MSIILNINYFNRILQQLRIKHTTLNNYYNIIPNYLYKVTKLTYIYSIIKSIAELTI